MTWDIVGDIHGEADALERLLKRLDYQERDGVYRHTGDRRVVFLGDFIDRGPQHLRTLEVVRRMLEQGTALAVMGNHEFNAIGFATPDPAQPGRWMRPHSAEKIAQHRVFLDQIGEGSALHHELVAWFKTLPLWLDLGELRIVHACWHPQELALIQPHVDTDARLRSDAWIEALRYKTGLFNAMEIILKGVEMKLPDGVIFTDEGGHERDHIRVAWWRSAPQTARQVALVDEGTRTQIPNTPLAWESVYTGSVPVFIGHYWLEGTPEPLTKTVACVDYSVAKGGQLVAYRWDGSSLDDNNFVGVPARLP
ncbi:MAG: metallophosphoesterase [Myxococcota bacterium]